MMKKMMTVAGMAGAVALVAGCAFVGLEDATPDWKETRALAESYEVINPKAHGWGTIHQISLVFTPVFKWGGSFEAGYQDVLKKNPDADDIINVRSNITGMNFLLYQCYSINIYGTAIKYTSDGKGNTQKK